MEPSEYKPFDPQVHEYVDGRMSADAERDFARKLEHNPELKGQVASLRKALELLRALPADEPKEGFNDRVIGRVREVELAERARKQIVSAPVPIWQHVVQVGLGAAAAALVFAIIGVPGLFHGDETDVLSGEGGIARVSTTEEDLLPALADHCLRFESMRRSVSSTRLQDPHEQRQLIAMELEHSDLLRRNLWLQAEVSELPSNRRIEYTRFLDSLESALLTMQTEINASLQETRPVDLAAIDSALAGVQAPRGAVRHISISNTSGALLPETERVGAEGLNDVALYALVRRAEYRHDHEAVIDATNVYLKHMKTGRFKHHAGASAVAALLRLGHDREAAERFAADFGDYDEDLTEAQRKAVQGMLTDAELKRLGVAREALRKQ